MSVARIVIFQSLISEIIFLSNIAIEYVEGVAKLEDGIILIHDIDKFLSLEEEKALTDAVNKK